MIVRITLILLVIIAVLYPDFIDACTAFSFSLEEGQIMGCNLDFGWGEGYVVVNKRNLKKDLVFVEDENEQFFWISQYGSISYNFAGQEHPWCGMNEAGLMVCMLWLNDTVLPEADERMPVRGITWVQYQLDNSATIQEVIKSDEDIRLTGEKCHFFVCDIDGNTAVFEYLDDGLVCYTDEDLPERILTNHPYGEKVENTTENTDSPLSSRNRFSIVSEMLKKTKPRNTKGAVPYVYNILHSVSGKSTKWNVVMSQANRNLYFKTAENNVYRRVNMNNFNYNCFEPVMMLDINAKGGGDKSKHFLKYDHQASLDIFKRFSTWWGIELSPEQSEACIKTIEDFECQEEMN